MSKKEHFQIYIAVYLILMKDEKVLLLRRCNTSYQDGNYSLIAGHLDGEETAKQGIIREAKEEANITLHPENLQVAHVMHRLSADREYIHIYLTAKRWDGEIKNLEPEKCDDLQWFSFSALPSNIVPEVKTALENVRDGKFYGEFGWQA